MIYDIVIYHRLKIIAACQYAKGHVVPDSVFRTRLLLKYMIQDIENSGFSEMAGRETCFFLEGGIHCRT